MPSAPPPHRPAHWKPPAQRAREYDQRRGTPQERGYGKAWREASAAFLARPENRWCCCGCGRRADMVDHKRPHRGDPRLFWDLSNWQPMARVPCHARKTAARDGGFGNPIR